MEAAVNALLADKQAPRAVGAPGEGTPAPVPSVPNHDQAAAAGREAYPEGQRG